MRMLLRAAILVAISAAPALAADPCTDPANVAKANEALAKARAKSYAEATAAANAALAACPTQAVAVQALGQTLVAQKAYDDAIARMTTAIAAKKELAYAYMWRGYAYSYKKQPDKMAEDFRTFLKLSPNAPEAPSVKQYMAGLGR
jgi:tetratricopeptide (TPR) repeat protein